MAKKKASSNAQLEKKPLQNQEENTVKPHQQPPPPVPDMDSKYSEIDNLKSLNQRLLKETIERRKQIDTLVRSKESLSEDLGRSNAERDALKSQLAWLGETVAGMDLERGVVADFVAEQIGLKREDVRRSIEGLEMEMAALKSEVGEKETEIERLNGKLIEAESVLRNEMGISRRISLEEDEMKNELDLQIEKTKRLEENLSESEDAIREKNQKIEELNIAFNDVLAVNEDFLMRLEYINGEKASIVRDLEEVSMLKEGLGEQLSRVVREKEAIEEEKAAEMVKREELENTVSGLNEMVAGLLKEEEKLRETVAMLKRQCREGHKKWEEMRREIDQLVDEKSLRDGKVEWLLDEKNMVEKKLVEAMKQVDVQKLKNEELVNVKTVTEEAKVQLEGEVVALRNEVAELEAVVSRLKEFTLGEAEKIKSLNCVVAEYKKKLAVVESAKAEMESRVCEEEKNSAALKGVIGKLENKVKESLDNSVKAKAENAAILAEKSAIESERKVLKEKIASLKCALTEARNEVDSIKCKAQLTDARSECVLNMLKDTVAFCTKDGNDAEDGNPGGDKQVNDEYATELEMIRNAFRSKARKVESMKRQLEFLQSSVEEAHKRKGFWTMLSSATTVLAAVSIAYVARSH